MRALATIELICSLNDNLESMITARPRHEVELVKYYYVTNNWGKWTDLDKLKWMCWHMLIASFSCHVEAQVHGNSPIIDTFMVRSFDVLNVSTITAIKTVGHRFKSTLTNGPAHSARSLLMITRPSTNRGWRVMTKRLISGWSKTG